MTPVKAFDDEAAKPHVHKQCRKQPRKRDWHLQRDVDDSPMNAGSGKDTKEKASAIDDQESLSPQTDSLLGTSASLSRFLRARVDPFRASVVARPTQKRAQKAMLACASR